jgi:hypothetical protein
LLYINEKKHKGAAMFRKIYKFVKVTKDVINTASVVVEHIITTTKDKK